MESGADGPTRDVKPTHRKRRWWVAGVIALIGAGVVFGMLPRSAHGPNLADDPLAHLQLKSGIEYRRIERQAEQASMWSKPQLASVHVILVPKPGHTLNEVWKEVNSAAKAQGWTLEPYQIGGEDVEWPYGDEYVVGARPASTQSPATYLELMLLPEAMKYEDLGVDNPPQVVLILN